MFFCREKPNIGKTFQVQPDLHKGYLKGILSYPDTIIQNANFV